MDQAIDSRQLIDNALRALSARAYAKYKTHSYEAGYFHSLIVDLVTNYVPENERQRIINQVARVAT